MNKWLIIGLVPILFLLLLFVLTQLEMRDNDNDAKKSLETMRTLGLPLETQLISSFYQVVGVENGNNCAPEIKVLLHSSLSESTLQDFYHQSHDQTGISLKSLEPTKKEDEYTLTFIDWSKFTEATFDYRCW